MTRLPLLEVRPAHGGLGVFALEPVRRDRRVLAFTGARFGRAHIEAAAARGEHDGFLQIGPGVYLGLSGRVDDYVNHGCDANCYVHIGRHGIWLKALRAVRGGEELTFDYGATQVDFPFRFRCACGSARCRGEIGNYDEIGAEMVARYLQRGVFPAHVKARLSGSPGDRLDVA